jgi:hypothetical protein
MPQKRLQKGMPQGVPFLFLTVIRTFRLFVRVFRLPKVFIQMLAAPATLRGILDHNRDSAAVNLNQHQDRFCEMERA